MLNNQVFSDVLLALAIKGISSLFSSSSSLFFLFLIVSSSIAFNDIFTLRLSNTSPKPVKLIVQS